MRTRLFPEQARNRLFHAAPIALTSPGGYIGRLRVSRDESAEVIEFEVDVAPATSTLLLHWRAFAVAPIGLVVFALHQFGRAKRRASTATEE